MPAERRGEPGRELRWVDWIRKLEGAAPRGAFPVGIGDDAAVWRPPPGKCAVLTVDAQVEGVHFRSGWLSPRELGARAVSSSVSDLAAMAATPVAVLIAVATGRNTRDADLKKIQLGAHEAARSYGARVIGGNLSEGPLSITVTAIGEGRASDLVTRSGAKPGDEVWVTGAPGSARIGLRCLERGLVRGRSAPGAANRRSLRAALHAFATPTARVREAIEISRRWSPSAMIDLSDGLATDLRHILDESSRATRRSIGAEIDVEALPVNRRLASVASLCGESLVTAAVNGGEDYELCFTAPATARLVRLLRRFRERFATPITRIGRIVRRPGIRLLAADGSAIEVTSRGWTHF